MRAGRRLAAHIAAALWALQKGHFLSPINARARARTSPALAPLADSAGSPTDDHREYVTPGDGRLSGTHPDLLDAALARGTPSCHHPRACAEAMHGSVRSAQEELILLWLFVAAAAIPLYVAWAVLVLLARHALTTDNAWNRWAYFMLVALCSVAAGSLAGDLAVWPGVIVALLGLAAYGVAKHERRRLEQAKALIRAHATELAIRRAQLLTRGHYGVVDRKRWDGEIGQFIDTVVAPAVGQVFDLSAKLRDEIEAAAASVQPEIAFNPGATPIEYEHLVAETLRRHGWDARTTKASGDQGIDVLATKGALRVVLQCKLYARPVGNAAVQEAIAGQRFASATHAAVVSNAVFTKAAQQLATIAGVLLLHHEELPTLERRISVSGALPSARTSEA